MVWLVGWLFCSGWLILWLVELLYGWLLSDWLVGWWSAVLCVLVDACVGCLGWYLHWLNGILACYVEFDSSVSVL